LLEQPTPPPPWCPQGWTSAPDHKQILQPKTVHTKRKISFPALMNPLPFFFFFFFFLTYSGSFHVVAGIAGTSQILLPRIFDLSYHPRTSASRVFECSPHPIFCSVQKCNPREVSWACCIPRLWQVESFFRLIYRCPPGVLSSRAPTSAPVPRLPHNVRTTNFVNDLVEPQVFFGRVPSPLSPSTRPLGLLGSLDLLCYNAEVWSILA